MASQNNTLLQKLTLLGLVSSVAITSGSLVMGQIAPSVSVAGYEATLEEARTLAEMIAVNPESPAAQQALGRLQVLLAQLPPAVRAQVVQELAATASLPPSVIASIVEALPNVPLATVTPAAPTATGTTATTGGYF